MQLRSVAYIKILLKTPVKLCPNRFSGLKLLTQVFKGDNSYIIDGIIVKLRNIFK